MIEFLKIEENKIYTKNCYLQKGMIIGNKIEITSNYLISTNKELGSHYIYQYKKI